jgi:hypothetical protein
VSDARPLRAIETEYRGFRFRSRTEARYAVFFDAAGIDWQYEVEGFHLNGARYLPDFCLPELKTYVEVKPTKEAAEQAAALLLALKDASGCDVMFGIGSPAAEPPGNFFWCWRRDDGSPALYRANPAQCPFCNRLVFNGTHRDACTSVQVLRWPPWRRSDRLLHALGEAQRARFEFGETGEPRPYTPPPATHSIRVYAAGAIFREMGPNEAAGVTHPNEELEPWRAEVFGCDLEDLCSQPRQDHPDRPVPTVGRFVYAGPTIVDNHGGALEGLADECLAEVAGAHALFAWVDREETVGTLAEIGAAHAYRKPIFVAFADAHLAEHFYFIKQLATVAVITDVTAAWNLFARWQAGA